MQPSQLSLVLLLINKQPQQHRENCCTHDTQRFGQARASFSRVTRAVAVSPSEITNESPSRILRTHAGQGERRKVEQHWTSSTQSARTGWSPPLSCLQASSFLLRLLVCSSPSAGEGTQEPIVKRCENSNTTTTGWERSYLTSKIEIKWAHCGFLDLGQKVALGVVQLAELDDLQLVLQANLGEKDNHTTNNPSTDESNIITAPARPLRLRRRRACCE